jgi:hypothetical protein
VIIPIAEVGFWDVPWRIDDVNKPRVPSGVPEFINWIWMYSSCVIAQPLKIFWEANVFNTGVLSDLNILAAHGQKSFCQVSIFENGLLDFPLDWWVNKIAWLADVGVEVFDTQFKPSSWSMERK